MTAQVLGAPPVPPTLDEIVYDANGDGWHSETRMLAESAIKALEQARARHPEVDVLGNTIEELLLGRARVLYACYDVDKCFYLHKVGESEVSAVRFAGMNVAGETGLAAKSQAMHKIRQLLRRPRLQPEQTYTKHNLRVRLRTYYGLEAVSSEYGFNCVTDTINHALQVSSYIDKRLMAGDTLLGRQPNGGFEPVLLD